MKKEREKTKGNENIDVTTHGIAANALNKGTSEKRAVGKKWTGYKKNPGKHGPVGIDMCERNNYFSSVSIAFQSIAAIAPPTSGPTMKIQRFVSAVPPWKSAGPIERAGLTDVPV